MRRIIEIGVISFPVVDTTQRVLPWPRRMVATVLEKWLNTEILASVYQCLRPQILIRRHMYAALPMPECECIWTKFSVFTICLQQIQSPWQTNTSAFCRWVLCGHIFPALVFWTMGSNWSWGSTLLRGNLPQLRYPFGTPATDLGSRTSPFHVSASLPVLMWLL